MVRKNLIALCIVSFAASLSGMEALKESSQSQDRAIKELLENFAIEYRSLLEREYPKTLQGQNGPQMAKFMGLETALAEQYADAIKKINPAAFSVVYVKNIEKPWVLAENRGRALFSLLRGLRAIQKRNAEKNLSAQEKKSAYESSLKSFEDLSGIIIKEDISRMTDSDLQQLADVLSGKDDSKVNYLLDEFAAAAKFLQRKEELKDLAAEYMDKLKNLNPNSLIAVGVESLKAQWRRRESQVERRKFLIEYLKKYRDLQKGIELYNSPNLEEPYLGTTKKALYRNSVWNLATQTGIKINQNLGHMTDDQLEQLADSIAI